MFHQVRSQRRRGLCLVRYEAQASDNGHPSGAWWTSCRAARRLRSVEAVRARLALLTRFQPNVDYRLRAQLPPTAYTSYLVGKVAPQCEGPGDSPPCYAGGASQYWFFDSTAPAEWITKRDCLAEGGAGWTAC